MKKSLLFTFFATAMLLLSCNNSKSSKESEDASEPHENNTSQSSDRDNSSDKDLSDASESIIEKNKADFLQNYKQYLKLELNGKVDGLGGLYEATLHISNTTSYFINSVSVQVTAYKASGDYYDSQIIEFTNIQPHEKLIMPVKTFSRGSTFDKEIISVYCRELNNARISPVQPD